MSIGGIIGVIVGSIVVFILLILAVSYVKAPPDTAIIITGPRKQRVLIGKAGFRWPFIQRIDKLPLNLIQVDIKTPDAVPTSEFINIFVDGVANIKIGNTTTSYDGSAAKTSWHSGNRQRSLGRKHERNHRSDETD